MKINHSFDGRPAARKRRCLLFAALIVSALTVSTGSHAAAVYADDLTGDEHVTTFEGFVGYDSFIIVANTGQKWDHDDALFSHTGTFAGLGLSTRIPLTGGTNTVMLTQAAGAGILVEFDVPVALAGATIFADRTTATFFNQSGAILGSVTSDLFANRQFIGWSADPGTGWIQSVLFEDYYPLDNYGLAIDNLVRGDPVPLPAPALLLGAGLAGLVARRRHHAA